MYTYKIYGLIFAVPFQCSMLSLAKIEGPPDITIVEGPVAPFLMAPAAEGENWQAAPGQYLLRGGLRAGRFFVEDGNKITLQRNPAAEDERLCAFLLTTVIVALLRQRGFLILHANVVLTPNGAVAISGESGAGKSTALAALLMRGCTMVADDVTVLSLGDNGEVFVLPGIPKINLCEDTAAMLGHDIKHLPRNPLRKIKVFVPVGLNKMETEPVVLKRLYLLSCHAGDEMKVTRLSGTEKFGGQQECIYGPLFPEEHHGLFSIISALAERVEMIRIDRPETGCSINEVAEAILHG